MPPPTREEIDRQLWEYLQENRSERRAREDREQRLNSTVDSIRSSVEGLRSDFAVHAERDEQRFGRMADRLTELDGDIEDSKTHHLDSEKEEKKTLRKKAEFWPKTIVAAIAAVVGGILVAAFGYAFLHH